MTKNICIGLIFLSVGSAVESSEARAGPGEHQAVIDRNLTRKGQ